jgi:hypothetical protein
MGIAENKSPIRGMFFDPQNEASTHHDPPRFHHKFTSEKPHSTTRFRQNPQQKRTNPHKK